MSTETTPYLLSGEVTIPVTAGVPGPPQGFPIAQLVNTLRVPIEIREIHFVATQFKPIGTGNAGTLYNGLEVDIALGRYGITNGLCPLRSIGMVRTTDRNEGPGFIAFDYTSDQFRWILPRPLIVRAQEGFRAFARLSPRVIYEVSTGTVTLTMVMRGRRMDMPARRERDMPYASGWIFTAGLQFADQRIFSNNFRTPLYVSSLNLRSLISTFDQVNAQMHIVGPGGLSNVMRREITAPPVGASQVFNQETAIDVGHQLNPDDGYSIQFGPSAAAIDSHMDTGSIPAGSTGPVAIVMSGYRKEIG
jgi:hypothetical protein